jgi:uncharacterized membrane protein YccC
MPLLSRRLGELLRSGPNRIALSTAMRGTLATCVPLALLPLLGAADLTYPAVLGSLATSLVDVGGPYRTRLVAMLLQAAGGPCLLLLGALVSGHWWLAAALMAAIGLLSGLIRALGAGGTSLGNHAAIAFLVGLQLGGRHAQRWALGYGCGGMWTVAVALGFWQLRPYRRLEQEVAVAWQAVAVLLRAVAAPAEGSVVARRRREQRIAAAHAGTRAALERARDALGEMRAGTAGPGTSVAQLIVLLDSAAAVGATAVSLCETCDVQRPGQISVERELARACRAVAGVLLDGNGALPLAAQHRALEAARARAPRAADDAGAAERAALFAWAQGLRSLDAAEEALRSLFGARHRMPDLLRLPFAHRLPRGTVVNALRAHLTPRSAIFRHAMRVAAVTCVDTLFLVRYQLPHGIWLPLTSLVILQPDYGGTAARALQRALGTIAGAVIAGVLLSTLHGTPVYDVALAALLFVTFLLIRRNYGYGIMFLTPIIILLIGMSSIDPWIDLIERVAYTVAGALLALAAAYLLWPRWERDRLRERIARAVRADRLFIDAVLQARLESASPESLAAAQRDAEMAIANADASFQLTVAEPARRMAPLGVAFAVLVYLHRLCRHAIALAAQPDGTPLPREPLDRLRLLVVEVLDEVGRVVAEGRLPVPWPSLPARLTDLAAQLTRPTGEKEPGGGAVGATPAESSVQDEGADVATLLARLMSDLTGLLNAAGYSQVPSPGAPAPLASTSAS